MSAGKLDRLLLLIGKRDLQLRFNVRNDLIIVRLVSVFLMCHGTQPLGNAALVIIKPCQIAGFNVHDLLADQYLPLKKLIKHFRSKRFRNTDHLCAYLHKLAARNERMADTGIVGKLKLDRREHAFGAVPLKAVRQRERVRLGERGSDLVLGQDIRILPHELKCALAIRLIRTRCDDRSDLRSRQKFDQSAQAHQLTELRRHLLGFLRTDSAHLAQLLRLKLQHVQSVGAEALHQKRGRRGSDPAHGMTRKILVDRICRLRHGAFDIFGLKLHSVGRMMRPHAAHGNQFSGSRKRNAAEDRHLITVIGIQAQDRIAVFFILIDDRGNAAADLHPFLRFVHVCLFLFLPKQ